LALPRNILAAVIMDSGFAAIKSAIADLDFK